MPGPYAWHILSLEFPPPIRFPNSLTLPSCNPNATGRGPGGTDGEPPFVECLRKWETLAGGPTYGM